MVHGQVPYWGILPQQGDESEAPVEVSYTLKRPRKTEFGDRPLPGGVARLYPGRQRRPAAARGRSGDGSHAGGRRRPAAAGHRLRSDGAAGPDQLRHRRDSTKAGGVRTVATADYRVTVSNATDSAVTVDVLEERGGEWSVLQSSVPAEKLSSTLTRFRVKVPARGRGGADLSRPRSCGEMSDAPVAIAHLSDLHFGGYADLAQIEALEDVPPDARGRRDRSSPAT